MWEPFLVATSFTYRPEVVVTGKSYQVLPEASKAETEVSMTKPELGELLIHISKSTGKRGPRLERNEIWLTSNCAPRSTVMCSSCCEFVPTDIQDVVFLPSTAFSLLFAALCSLETFSAVRPVIGESGSGTAPDKLMAGGSVVSISK